MIKIKFVNQSIRLVMSYCKKNNIKLLILTWAGSKENKSHYDISILEEKYYNKLLGVNNFQLIKKISLAIAIKLPLNLIILFLSTLRLLTNYFLETSE